MHDRKGRLRAAFFLGAMRRPCPIAEQADRRYAQFLEAGQSIPWEDARAWLRQRLAGKPAKWPAVRKQAR